MIFYRFILVWKIYSNKQYFSNTKHNPLFQDDILLHFRLQVQNRFPLLWIVTSANLIFRMLNLASKWRNLKVPKASQDRKYNAGESINSGNKG